MNLFTKNSYLYSIILKRNYNFYSNIKLSNKKNGYEDVNDYNYILNETIRKNNNDEDDELENDIIIRESIFNSHLTSNSYDSSSYFSYDSSSYSNSDSSSYSSSD